MTNPMLQSSSKLSEADKAARFGMWAVIIGFGGFMLWAAFAPLSEGIIATGSIMVEGNRKTIQHLEGGIVSAIHVREGAKVKAGEILVELDNTQSKAQHELLQVRHDNHLAVLDRLNSERKNANKVSYNKELIARQNNVRVAQLIDIQNDLFAARQAQLDGQISIFKKRVVQIKEQLQGLEEEKKAKDDEISYIQDELSRLVELDKENLVGLPRLLAQKKSLSQAMGAAGKLKADMGAAKVELGKAELEIIQLRKDHQQEIAEMILTNQEQYFEVQERIVAMADVLNRTIVRAPQAGKVMGLNVWTIGGVVPPGSSLLEIVPDERRLVVEARVRVTDIDNVLVGLPARIRLSGLRQRTTPELAGKVEDVSADVMMDEARQESYYVAKIAISEEEFARITDDEILPGMPVEILIEAGSRTALEYFMSPITDVMRRAMTED
ncbi:MAG: HlyD family type I secretion periplasmic adaptor subunit [Emcibacter sp.]|nr:HlyD family type I secretion periplasmic adaptor subunit [Emcibacter sp.]